MFARITTVQGTPGQRNAELAGRVVETVQKQPGCKGIYLLTDQETGENISVSLWETEGQAKTVGQAVTQARDEALAAVGSTTAPTIKVYEVVSQA